MPSLNAKRSCAACPKKCKLVVSKYKSLTNAIQTHVVGKKYKKNAENCNQNKDESWDGVVSELVTQSSEMSKTGESRESKWIYRFKLWRDKNI